jgi:tRNA(Ile)-lysidine synthase
LPLNASFACRVPSDLTAHFSAQMAQFGPFGPAPRFAVAVSGGADSTALALLTQHWAQHWAQHSAQHRHASLRAFIVDHQLRSDASAEAELTRQRLTGLGIDADILVLRDLSPGPALQERARHARYHALTQAARAYGAPFLLVGHHADDQTELIAMRAARGPRGLHGIAPWSARADLVILRPLLAVPRATLRHYLTAHNIPWIEDPSNANPAFERVRLRQFGLATRPASPALMTQHREEAAATAQALAANVRLSAEGFAVIMADHLAPEALSALIRVVGGAQYKPPRAAVARLAAKLTAATLGGVQIAASRRLGGFLLAREPIACELAVEAHAGALWDHRFLLGTPPAGATRFGALGAWAREYRRHTALPSRVLRTLPALFAGQELLAVPHLGVGPACRVEFAPPYPATTDPGHATMG